VSAILTIAAKDLRLLARNRGHLVFTFVWPLVTALFFGTVFGGSSDDPGRIPVLLVDEDGSDASRALMAAVGRLSGVDARPVPEGRDTALQRVRRGTATAAVIAPAGYGAAGDRLFAGPAPVVELHVDPSRTAEAAMLEGQLMGAAMERLSEVFAGGERSVRVVDRALQNATAAPRPDPALTGFLGEVKRFVGSRPERAPAEGTADGTPDGTSEAWRPVAITRFAVQDEREGPRSGYEVSLPQGVIWGMIGCALGFAMGLVNERTRGTMARLCTSPIGRVHVLAGKGVACFAALAAVQTMLFALGAGVLGVVPGSILRLAVAGACLAFAFVGLMMVVATLARSEQSASGLAWAVFLPLSMLGGGMVPLFALPGWMQTAGTLSPVKWGILALEGALWRGFGWAELALPCGILLAVGAVGFGLGVRRFDRSA
jgi:ABC-2 type transport system permease protein